MPVLYSHHDYSLRDIPGFDDDEEMCGESREVGWRVRIPVPYKLFCRHKLWVRVTVFSPNIVLRINLTYPLD
jgi:hypothetical protein